MRQCVDERRSREQSAEGAMVAVGISSDHSNLAKAASLLRVTPLLDWLRRLDESSPLSEGSQSEHVLMP